MRIEIVKNPKQGLELAKHVLYKNVDSKTALFLSGGTTPRSFYEKLAREKKLRAGSVALVDERYGEPFHQKRNEKMIKDTGLIKYFKTQDIPFYSPLHDVIARDAPDSASRGDLMSEKRLLRRLRLAQAPRNDIEDIAEDYDKDVDYLLSDFPKRIAVMGIGEDGHTAGLPPGNGISILRQAQDKNQKYVTGIRDFPGEFRQRITLTFKALSKMDLLIVLVFGERKRGALRLMLEKGSVEEIPARFYKRSDIAKKTILITDQKV